MPRFCEKHGHYDYSDLGEVCWRCRDDDEARAREERNHRDTMEAIAASVQGANSSACQFCGQQFVEKTRVRPRIGLEWTGLLGRFSNSGLCPKCYHERLDRGEERAWSDAEWTTYIGGQRQVFAAQVEAATTPTTLENLMRSQPQGAEWWPKLWAQAQSKVSTLRELQHVERERERERQERERQERERRDAEAGRRKAQDLAEKATKSVDVRRILTQNPTLATNWPDVHQQLQARADALEVRERELEATAEALRQTQARKEKRREIIGRAWSGTGLALLCGIGGLISGAVVGGVGGMIGMIFINHRWTLWGSIETGALVGLSIGAISGLVAGVNSKK